MIECIFTIDYEIYGNGEGSLAELVYEPMAKLMEIFEAHKMKIVIFAEAAELEIIEQHKTDPAIYNIKDQLGELYQKGFEIGLHLHPQWYNAKNANGKWLLDYDEYNICTLSREKITQIIDRSITYLQKMLNVPDYIPFSFRAGNWLFQPTEIVASVLSKKGIKIDSSVFKGGLQHQHHLDYRKAIKNGNYWKFTKDVNVPDLNGIMIELPIYTQMVPFWKMLTGKRVGLQQKLTSSNQTTQTDIKRYLDFLRFRYPLKFDFCRMNLEELIEMTEKIIKNNDRNPSSYCPIVSIGHTKDLVDCETVNSFLCYLEEKRIHVTTFNKSFLNFAS